MGMRMTKKFKWFIFYRCMMMLGIISVTISALVLLWQMQIILSLNNAYWFLDL